MPTAGECQQLNGCFAHVKGAEDGANSKTLAEWLVEDGELVEAGKPIYCLETDKYVQEIEAQESGRLTQKVAAGETYPVGTQIGEIISE